MLTLSLWKKANPDLDFSFIGDKIGDGADGEVFELTNEANKVIKISIIFDYEFNNNCNLQKAYSALFKSLNKLNSLDPSICARVYKHNLIGLYQRDCLRVNNTIKQNYLLHYHIMEKCFKLSDDEKKIFHTIISHEDRGIVKNYSPEKLKEILFGLSQGLDFDDKKVIFFYESLMASPIKHLDLHPRNIMKNKFGDYKLIDFDRLRLENL